MERTSRQHIDRSRERWWQQSSPIRTSSARPRRSSCQPKSPSVLLLVFIAFCCCNHGGVLVAHAASLGSDLYNESDAVHIVHNVQEFEEVLTRSTARLNLVEFYSAWCGHCARYAPIFKEFAFDVKAWWPILQVHVVNCASDGGSKVCSREGVGSVPTLKIYRRQDGRAPSESPTNISADRDIAILRKNLINHIESTSSFPLEGILTLAPSRATSVDELFADASPAVTQILAVLEEESSYFGRELILDLNNYSNKTKAVRFISGTGPEELRKYNATSLVLLERGQQPKLLASVKDNATTRKIFKEKLHALGLGNLSRDPLSAVIDHPIRPDTNVEYDVSQYPRKVYIDDLENALYYNLHSEVLKLNLNKTDVSILRNFMEGVYEDVPFPKRITSYLKKVHDRLMHVKIPLSQDEYDRILNESTTTDSYLRHPLDFVACRGDKPGYHGYPCTLWTTYHTMTVGSYVRYLNHKVQYPQKTLLDITKFVINFFSCEDCREHFKNASRNIESEIPAPEDTVLWLWRVHNQVNARLKGDKFTDDPKRPKIQFPPKEFCPSCRDANGKFVKAEVLKFLLHFYGKDNIVAASDEPHSETTKAGVLHYRAIADTSGVALNIPLLGLHLPPGADMHDTTTTTTTAAILSSGG